MHARTHNGTPHNCPQVSAVALLEAATSLLAEGWSPERTLMLAFGQDEEVGGAYGAGVGVGAGVGGGGEGRLFAGVGGWRSWGHGPDGATAAAVHLRA